MSRTAATSLLAGAVLAATGPDRLGAQRGQVSIPDLTGKVLTVRGPIDPSALGFTLMHEHIFIDFKAPATAGGAGSVETMKRYTDRGAYVEFDYMGTGKGPGSGAALAQAAERIARNIKALIDAGLTDRILVAQDVCTQAQLKKNGGGGYAYVSTVVMPALRALGVTDATISKILVDNPRRVLTFTTPRPGAP